jgi:hypothetical protein
MAQFGVGAPLQNQDTYAEFSLEWRKWHTI